MSEYEPDYNKNPQQVASKWLKEIASAEKYFKKYLSLCDKIEARFRGDKKASESDLFMGKENGFPIYWSSIKTLQPAIYSRTPKPVVRRRWRDRDPIGNLASEVLQRSLEAAIDLQEFDSSLISVRDDMIFFARGVPWVRYAPVFTQEEQELELDIPEAEIEIETVDVLQDERVLVDYVYRCDFLHNPARKYSDTEIKWVARRHSLTKDEVEEKFGEEEQAENILFSAPITYEALKYESDGADKTGNGPKKLSVWEIWDKPSRTIIFVTSCYKEAPLQIKKVDINIPGFFPCPTPAYGTLTNSSTVPIPDMVHIESILNELDDLTIKESELVEAIKVTGVYDASLEGLQRLAQEGTTNELVPVKNFTRYKEQGGFSGAIDWWPIGAVVSALKETYVAKERKKAEFYEITGWSDLMRGYSDPRTSATAEQMKGQYLNLRLAERQKEMQRVARDVIRIMGAYICQYFSPESIERQSGAAYLPDYSPDMFIAAVETLKTESATGESFRIDIETDSTVAIDEQQQKADVMEFVTTVADLSQRMFPIMAQEPAIAGMYSQLLMYAARSMRAGDALEGSIEQAINGLMQQAAMKQQQAMLPPAAEPPPIDPGLLKVQADADMKQQELQLKKYEIDTQAQLEAAKIRAENQSIDTRSMLNAQEMQGRTAIAAQKAEAEMQLALAKAALIEQDKTIKALKFRQGV